jgi:hypothetical protein
VQHEPFAVIPAWSSASVMVSAPQQARWPDAGMASKQADAGIAVQKTVIASINSALFLAQFKVSRLRVSIVSI